MTTGTIERHDRTGADAVEDVAAPPRPPRRRRAAVVSVAVVVFVCSAALVGRFVGPTSDGSVGPPTGDAAVSAPAVGRSAPVPQNGVDGRVDGGGDGGVDGEISGDVAGGGPADVGTGTAESVPPPGAASTLPGTGPRVVRTASLTVVVERADAVDAAVAEARTTAESNGGYVADLQRSDVDGTARATVTLRVPATSFDAVTARVERVGDVVATSMGGQDVTQESVDLDARLRSLQAEADALRAILAKAASVADILAVRQQLNGVQTEIETVTARVAQLDDAVAFATVTATFATSAGSVVPQPRSWWHRTLGDAVARLGDVVGAIVVGTATLLPIVLLVAVVGVTWTVVRRRRAAASA